VPYYFLDTIVKAVHAGPEGAKMTRQHIISDIKEEGWPEKDPFPKHEADYVKIGFF
jgi:hypothetical protein